MKHLLVFCLISLTMNDYPFKPKPILVNARKIENIHRHNSRSTIVQIGSHRISVTETPHEIKSKIKPECL